jgi:RimJ/RimL family protein N-acetyltransferase
MSIVIRTAQPGDAGQLLAYLRHLVAEPDLNIPLAPDELELSMQEKELVLSGFAARRNCVYLVAELDGEIIGEINLEGGQRQATRHAAVLGMSVGREWRNQGMGAALLETAIDWARGTGIITRIELNVYARNRAAIHLYRKFGFEVEGRRRQAIYRNGEYLDDLVMALLL